MTKPLSEEKLKQWRSGIHLGAQVPFVPVAPAKTSVDPGTEKSGIISVSVDSSTPENHSNIDVSS